VSKRILSQAVFASCLNLTADHVSNLERRAKRPTEPAVLLVSMSFGAKASKQSCELLGADSGLANGK
jgi:hypothetical protein